MTFIFSWNKLVKARSGNATYRICTEIRPGNETTDMFIAKALRHDPINHFYQRNKCVQFMSASYRDSIPKIVTCIMFYLQQLGFYHIRYLIYPTFRNRF